MQTVLLGLIFTPLDLVLALFEKRLYKRAGKPKLPLIFVCGAPRTGTTLVAQVIIKHLPVAYISNLSALFPRSPILVTRLFQKLTGKQNITYESFYGKTARFSGPNDAFYIWNEWMTAGPGGVRCLLVDSKKTNMVRFFGAYEQFSHRPLVNKNNSLNMCANSIAAVLENSHFICVTRDPVYLAQSLLRARIDLQGDANIGLWADNPGKAKTAKTDYIEDICRQVVFHEEKAKEQQNIIGSARFWIVSYEEFCKAPHELLKQISEKILHQPFDTQAITNDLKAFNHSNKIRLQADLFEKITKTLVQLRQTISDDSDPAMAESSVTAKATISL
jgi:hypothetical protein